MYSERDIQALFDALDDMRASLDNMADDMRAISDDVRTLCQIATDHAAITSKDKPAPR